MTRRHLHPCVGNAEEEAKQDDCVEIERTGIHLLSTQLKLYALQASWITPIERCNPPARVVIVGESVPGG